METKPTASLENLLVIEQAKLKRALLARNTRIGYQYDFELFRQWCGRMGREALPATSETVSLYLTDQLTEGKKVSTTVRRTSAITHMHRTSGLDTPVTVEVRRLLKGAQRLRGERPREMRPLGVAELRSIAVALARRNTALAHRNRAILILGFLSALRREDLALLETRDIEYCPEGIVLTIRRGKTDQESRGRYIAIPAGKRAATDPVRCLRAWMKFRGAEPGALFTHVPVDGRRIRGEAICRMVKKCVRMIGGDAREVGGHSLRSGFVVAATEAGAPDLAVAFQTGHRSMSTLRRYFRKRDLWRSNPAAMIGL